MGHHADLIAQGGSERRCEVTTRAKTTKRQNAPGDAEGLRPMGNKTATRAAGLDAEVAVFLNRLWDAETAYNQLAAAFSRLREGGEDAVAWAWGRRDAVDAHIIRVQEYAATRPNAPIPIVAMRAESAMLETLCETPRNTPTQDAVVREVAAEEIGRCKGLEALAHTYRVFIFAGLDLESECAARVATARAETATARAETAEAKTDRDAWRREAEAQREVAKRARADVERLRRESPGLSALARAVNDGMSQGAVMLNIIKSLTERGNAGIAELVDAKHEREERAANNARGERRGQCPGVDWTRFLDGLKTRLKNNTSKTKQAVIEEAIEAHNERADAEHQITLKWTGVESKLRRWSKDRKRNKPKGKR